MHTTSTTPQHFPFPHPEANGDPLVIANYTDREPLFHIHAVRSGGEITIDPGHHRVLICVGGHGTVTVGEHDFRPNCGDCITIPPGLIPFLHPDLGHRLETLLIVVSEAPAH